MEQNKIKAYQTLIYQAFLDIRVIASKLAYPSVVDVEDTKRSSLLIFHMTNAFHNLALSLAEDTISNCEDDFWSRIKFINEKFPESIQYKDIFNRLIQNSDC
ncbi:hypothetical protein [Paenibacillus xylanexedens]|uniref:hypothetical protein n=1 Tax=Paenibacillus xylanexedens TaxID=528191 RepID=UPI003B015019